LHNIPELPKIDNTITFAQFGGYTAI